MYMHRTTLPLYFFLLSYPISDWDRRIHDVAMTIQQVDGRWVECNFEDNILPSGTSRYYPCLGGLPLLNIPTSVLVTQGTNAVKVKSDDAKSSCIEFLGYKAEEVIDSCYLVSF